jgi:hypothetical protein
MNGGIINSKQPSIKGGIINSKEPSMNDIIINSNTRLHLVGYFY